jgi:hypothetical protein
MQRQQRFIVLIIRFVPSDPRPLLDTQNLLNRLTAVRTLTCSLLHVKGTGKAHDLHTRDIIFNSMQPGGISKASI